MRNLHQTLYFTIYVLFYSEISFLLDTVTKPRTEQGISLWADAIFFCFSMVNEYIMAKLPQSVDAVILARGGSVEGNFYVIF